MDLFLSLALLLLCETLVVYSIPSLNPVNETFRTNDAAPCHSLPVDPNVTSGGLSLVRKNGLTKNLSPRMDAECDPSPPPRRYQATLHRNKNWNYHLRHGKHAWDKLQAALSQGQLNDEAKISVEDNWETKSIAAEAFRPAVYLCSPGELLAMIDEVDYLGRQPVGVNKICDGTYDYLHLNSKEPIRFPDGSVRWFTSNNGLSLDARSFIVFDYQTSITTPDGVRHKAPDQWANVMLALWLQKCEKEHTQSSDLTYLTLADIQGDKVIYVLDQIVKKSRVRWTPPGVRTTPNSEDFILEPGQDEFFALLGTFYGFKLLQLLNHHAASFATRSNPNDPDLVTKAKSIRNIRIKVDSRNPVTTKKRDVVFTFEDIDLPRHQS